MSAFDIGRPSTPVASEATPPDGTVIPGTPIAMPQSRESQSEKSKYSSPPPPSSSMTPPPSSQMPNILRAVPRTPTPTTPLLSSPPPTIKQGAIPNSLGASGTTFASEDVARASVEELRVMVHNLLGALHEARTSAAHHKLQYNMLCLESSEASNRMAVELAMAQREVDVLQAHEQRRNRGINVGAQLGDISMSPSTSSLLNDLTRNCSLLQSENDELRHALGRATSLIDQHEGDIAKLVEENELLRGRIRKNREHMNSMFGHVYDRTPPRHIEYGSHSTPRLRGGSSNFPSDHSSNRKDRPFEALLLADKMLSQEALTAPSTPSRPSSQKHRSGHTRGTHSLSSLPSTPSKPRPRATGTGADFQTPPTFTAINKVPMSAPAQHYSTPSRRRRDSSDSTITASSAEENDKAPDEDEVQESQASSLATSMLRRASSSKRAAGTSASFPAKIGGKSQSKLFGHVRKPGMSTSWDEKTRSPRRSTGESPAKKSRLLGDVGLGIGGLASR